MSKPKTIIVQFWEAGCDPHNPTVEVEAKYAHTYDDRGYHQYIATTETGVFEVHLPIENE